MKKLFTLAFVVFCAWMPGFAQSCLPAGIIFTTQGQIDSFQSNYPGCHAIGGRVIISGADITDLAALSVIDSIAGDLFVSNNGHLTDLQGLHNLRFIGDTLKVETNPVLAGFTGFSQLTTIQGRLIVQNNALIQNFIGLQQLHTVKGIVVQGNSALINFSGLDSITTLSSGIEVFNNPVFENFTGLNNLTTIGQEFAAVNNAALKNFQGLNNLITIVQDISIGGNPALTTLTGLNNLKSCGGNLFIEDNDSLKNLTGLEAMTTIHGTFYLRYNEVLENLAGLGNLKTINFGSFAILLNPALQNLAGLQQLHYVRGSFTVHANYSLTDLSGIDSLRIAGECYIDANPVLTDLSALGRLDSLIGRLVIQDNDLLPDLHGLEALRVTGSLLSINGNALLNNINALHNLQSVGSDILIFDNPALNDCAVYPVCGRIFNHPELVNIYNNGAGCSTLSAVELACGGIPVLATVYVDNNMNCQIDTADTLAEGVRVQLSGSTQQSLRPTQSDGSAWFGYLNVGAFSLSLAPLPAENWQACQDTFWYLPDTITDTIRTNFLLRPLAQCPEMSVELQLPPFFRGCLVTTPVQVVARNIGTVTAEAVQVAVVMPPALILVSSSPPPTAQHGDTLFFAVGDVPPFTAGKVQMSVRTDCNSFLQGQTLCVEAFSSLANPCAGDTTDFSEIRLYSECLNDTTVRFTIKNVGFAATQNTHNYIILEDEIVLMQANFHLDAQKDTTVDISATGATYRMEATQYEDGSLTAVARENCGGFTPGFINAYWLKQGQHNYDFDCREVQVAYDPNQKTAIPTGVGPEHLLAANKSIQYTIEFQNTGTDTAFRVLLRDVLPPPLNPLSFRPGSASHPYSWQITGGDTLQVLFQPIMLPDSNVNEAASHGWFSFDIDQRPDLPDGTTIENTADIVFDYNPPIVTNTVLHTIGKLTVRVDEPQAAGQRWQVLGNPARYTVTFRSVDFMPGVKRFELTDAMGRVVRTEHFNGPEFEFRRDHLPGGLYFFRIYDATGKGTSGRIVLSE